MAISFINGFLCTSSCDAAKAKRGVDPHPNTGDPAAKPAETKNGVAATDDKGAVVLGGSLATTTGATAVAPVAATQSSVPANAQTPGQIVNVLA